MEVTPQPEKICCPRCGSSEISRSRLRGAMERYADEKWQLRPYRCYQCTLRFWKWRRPGVENSFPMHALKPFLQHFRGKMSALSSRLRHAPVTLHRRKKAA